MSRSPYIEKVLNDHLEWLESKGARGVQLVMAGADLRGAYLAECNLDEAVLSGSSIRNAKLRAVDIRGSDLSYARADSRTNLLHANLERAPSDPPGSKAEEKTKELHAATDRLRRRRDESLKGRDR